MGANGIVSVRPMACGALLSAGVSDYWKTKPEAEARDELLGLEDWTEGLVHGTQPPMLRLAI